MTPRWNGGIDITWHGSSKWSVSRHNPVVPGAWDFIVTLGRLELSVYLYTATYYRWLDDECADEPDAQESQVNA